MSTQILMPALSPTMEEGKLAKWHVKEGDEVHAGDVIAEIETDKATMEFEAADDGRIGKILVPEGTEGVKVNTPIAVLIGEGETAAVAEPKPRPRPTPAKAPAPAPKEPMPEAVKPAPVEGKKEDRVFASPLARRIAQQKGIDLAALAGTGPRGRIVKADVETAKPGADRPALGAPAPQPAAPQPAAPAASSGGQPDARLFYQAGDYDEIPHDLMRKAIGKRLAAAAASIPHFYLTVDCRIDNLLEARTKLNEAAPNGAYKLSVNDFLVKAAALALMRVPECNASWTETAVLRHKHADVGVAVALDFGLVTPIVFRAEAKGLAAISAEVRSLAERARAKKLKPREYEGGSFAISNLGMMGIKQFTAIINPPHAGILAVGAGERRAIVTGDKLEIATAMTVTMSCDHRVIDGATGARFLQAFKQFVEEPAAMLL